MSPPYTEAKFNPATGKWTMVDSLGYVRVYDEKPAPSNYTRYTFEHRQIAESNIGRPLQPGEIVHHLDGNRSNNSPSNVAVVESHLAHIRKEHPNWRKGEKFMHFPQSEHQSLKARLAAGLDIKTTRVGQEYGKYKVGMIYDSPFGRLVVDHIIEIPELSKHPDLVYLTEDQKKQLAKGPMQYLTLSIPKTRHEIRK